MRFSRRGAMVPVFRMNGQSLDSARRSSRAAWCRAREKGFDRPGTVFPEKGGIGPRHFDHVPYRVVEVAVQPVVGAVKPVLAVPFVAPA